MRRIWVVAILVAPAVAWGLLHAWAVTHIAQWTAERVTPGPVARAAVFLDNWLLWVAPFAILVSVLLGPFLSIGLARDGEPPDVDHERRRLIRWWLAMIGLQLLAGLVWWIGPGQVRTALAALWASYLAYCSCLASAYLIQQERVRRRRSRLRPAWLLLGGSLLALLVAPVAIFFPPAFWAISRRR